VQTCASTGESINQAFFTLAALIDSNYASMVQSSFSSLTFVESTETTKEGSDKSSVKAVYKHKNESFFLKR
jgi:hypothetical protein